MTNDNNNSSSAQNSTVFGEIQLILAEKRTSLAVMRTGISIIALPIAVLGILIATSKYYDVYKVLVFIILLSVILTVLFVIGAYFIVISVIKLHRYDKHINNIKINNNIISKYVE